MDNATPKKKGKKWPRVLVGFVVMIVLIASCSKSPSTQNTASNGQTDSKETPAALNEAVQSKDVSWTATAAKDLGSTLRGSQSRYPSITENKTTTGKYVQIDVTVENKGSDLASITSPILVDSQNREFTDASTNLSAWIPQDKELFLLSNLQPNLPKELTFIFEVPADATGLKLKVGVFSPKFIDLGF